MGHKAVRSPGPYCMQVEAECEFSFPLARWMWCSRWQLGCRMLSMPSLIQTTKSEWSRTGVHGIGDVVKCQCFLFQCDNAIIKYDNFWNYYCVISLVLYPIPKERVGVSAPQSLPPFFLSHYLFAVDSLALWGKHGCFVSCCLFGPFLCIVCSCDYCITVVICLPEEKMHTSTLFSWTM